jgi:hypothetical protein
MTTADKVFKTKVGLFEFGEQLGTVTQACRVMGYTRDILIDSKNSTEVERQRCKRCRGANPT